MGKSLLASLDFGSNIPLKPGFSFCFIVCLFRAAPATYRGSKARDGIGAPAAYTTATARADPSHIFDLHPSSQ